MTIISVQRVALYITALLLMLATNTPSAAAAPAKDSVFHEQIEMLQYGARQMVGGNQSDTITRAASAIGLAESEGSTGGLWKSSKQNQVELVRKLYDELASRVAEDISIMIFNHGQENSHDLRDVDAWRVIKIGQFDYDVWLFKCGIVLNTKSARGFDNWTYGGQCWYTTGGGNKVHFQHSDCPNYELRRMHHCGQHT